MHKSKLSNHCIVQNKQNGLTKVTNYPKSCPKDVKIQKYKILSQGSKILSKEDMEIYQEHIKYAE